MSGNKSAGKMKKVSWIQIVLVLIVLAVAAVVLVMRISGARDGSEGVVSGQNGQHESNGDTEKDVQPGGEQSGGTDNTEAVQTDGDDDGNQSSAGNVQTGEVGNTGSSEPVTDLQIDTPYCVLHYPAKWNGSVKTVTEQQENRFSVTFIGMIGEHETELFAIVFGESTEMPVGTLVQNDGTEITVRLNVDMFVPDDSWSEDEINLAYDMIGDSAYVLEGVTELENFR
ncbi:MAG: hypothetical protein IJ017_00035 [Oscillospiraceae bacterium]|nr:hypothetical protein [Oscillospiraceae bacterium]